MSTSHLDERVLVFAPTGRDAELSARVMANAGMNAVRCNSMQQLKAEFERGAPAAMLTEEALTPDSVAELLTSLHAQPPWSDLPVLLFTSGKRYDTRLEAWLREMGNVTLVDRPVRVATLISQLRGAKRARARQYETRDLLERLRASDQAKDQFLATLSHELRTPLTSILGWVQLLLRGRLTGDTQLNAFQTIERNARAQAQLVEDLLDVSRVVAGTLRLDVRPFELCAVVAVAVDSLRPIAQVKGVSLEVRGLDLAAPMLGDAARVQQIVTNVLGNAIKFTPAGGRVLIEVAPLANHHRITVRDDGQGIDPQFLPFVFDRFRQQDGGTTRRQGGLGLGLAIVRHLVELHKGTVRVMSDGLGKGSTVVIELPDPEAPIRDEPRRQTGVRPGALGGARVLVLEDEPDTRELITFTLRHFGAQVVAVSSVPDALGELARAQSDLIVSDIAMPGENGYSFLRKVRASGIRTPALALTALASTGDREEALSVGFDAHLAKPVDGYELANALAELWRKPQA